MSRHPRWAQSVPAPETYRAPRSRSIADAVAEQDRTAGGRERRTVTLPDGSVATASIELKRIGGRRVYAYLRYASGGRTVNRYVGEAVGSDREERLRARGALARTKGLLDV